MEWEIVFWVLFFLMDIALVAFNLYQMVCLSDLESDYMNLYETTSRINAVIIPEFLLHGVICVLFLVTGHWLIFLLTLPITYYNITSYMQRRHLLDVTEVFRSLNAEKKFRMIKLGFYFFLIIVIIFRLVVSVVNSLFDEDGIHSPWWE